jgi:hypothetical protein
MKIEIETEIKNEMEMGAKLGVEMELRTENKNEMEMGTKIGVKNDMDIYDNGKVLKIDDELKDIGDGINKHSICNNNNNSNTRLNINEREKTEHDLSIHIPLPIIEETFRIVKQTTIDYKNILEPAYFVNQKLIKHYDKYLNNVNITVFNGGENKGGNEDKWVGEFNNNTINLINHNFLSWNKSLNEIGIDDKIYDLIITTLPFKDIAVKEIKKHISNNDMKTYKDFMHIDGNQCKMNLMLFYIIKCLYLLKEKGILICIAHESLNSDIRFSKIRQFINDKFSLIDIVKCDEVIGNGNSDGVIGKEKGKKVNGNKGNGKCKHKGKGDYKDKSNDNYVFYIIKNRLPDNVILGRNKLYSFTLNKHIYFNANKHDNRILRVICKKAKTLEESNLKICVGKIIWSSIKNKLTDDTTQTRLIYSCEIGKGVLEKKDFGDTNKKNYTTIKGSSTPVIILNRTYGINKEDFNFAILDGSFEYVLDNHILYIEYTGRRLAFSDRDHKKRMISLYNKVIKSLQHDKLRLFADLYFGNREIKTHELEKKMPMLLL